MNLSELKFGAGAEVWRWSKSLALERKFGAGGGKIKLRDASGFRVAQVPISNLGTRHCEMALKKSFHDLLDECAIGACPFK